MSDDSRITSQDGVSSLADEVIHWSWSVDDRALALSLARRDDAGRSPVCVIDAVSGEAMFTARGTEVLGLGWASPELLLVIRSQPMGARAVMHSVPDGSVVASVALPSLHGGSHTVTANTLGGAASVISVLPREWHLGPGLRARRRVGYVLRAERGEVLREVDPSAWRALSTLPHARPTVTALDPDGVTISAWLGEPGDKPGHLVSYDWERDVARVIARGGREVIEVIHCDPTRALLRSCGRDASAPRGSFSLIDTQRGITLFDTALDAASVEWRDASLHPDRERVLLIGRSTRSEKSSGRLRAYDLVGGHPSSGCVEVATAAERVMGAVWADDSDAVRVLTSRGRSNARVQRWSSLGAPLATEGFVELALRGTSITDARLTSSPQRSWLTVSWRCVPATRDAAARALGVTRLAWTASG